MATVGNPVVEFSAKVPREDYEEFKENFPQYGAVGWFINSSLKEFNQQIRENKTLKEHINESIARMLQENREQSA